MNDDSPSVQPIGPSGRGLHRSVQVAMVIGALLVLWPLFIAAAMAVAVSSRGPIFFRQTRIGRDGKPFTLVKFRTMYAGSRGYALTITGDRRVTSAGRILRRFKIDELPQVWNVLRGDMSLVGPRPEVPQYVDLENPLWRFVLSVPPGITDPVSLILRNEEAVLAKAGVEPNVFYATHLQPRKLLGYAAYLRTRTWDSDIGVVCQTLLAPFADGAKVDRAAEEFVTSTAAQFPWS
jgi:lipopolysaccharide/colanic/teichoic acid biosynthesis glycosyltransferase